MASFFRPAVISILRVIRSQRDGARTTPSVSGHYYCPEVDCLRLLPQTVFLVGGFAANPWLYSSLKKELESSGMTLYRPDSHTYVFSTSFITEGHDIDRKLQGKGGCQRRRLILSGQLCLVARYEDDVWHGYCHALPP